MNNHLQRSFIALPSALRQPLLHKPVYLPSSILTYHPSQTSRRCLSLLHNSPRKSSPSTTRSASTASSPTDPISAQSSVRPITSTPPQEPYLPAPTPTSGPLLSRSANRALPTVNTGLSSTTRIWLTTLPLFLAICILGSLSIFNYQKSSSSTVNSILYALRTSPRCREILGDEIYFRSRVPWISGELNVLHGVIDIGFWVKGKKGEGKVRFVSLREKRGGFFKTREWSLEYLDANGAKKRVQLLDGGERDPLAGGERLGNVEDELREGGKNILEV